MKLNIFMKKALKAAMPYGFLVLYRHHKKINETRRVDYGNKPKSFCPVCRKKSYFKPFGIIPRKMALCTNCGSVERHRLLWLFFKNKTNLFDRRQKNILHVAAEKCFEESLKKIFSTNYITADLNNHNAMVKMDITDIHYPDEHFDVIICNHVLEHVPDDTKAMKEFNRVLKKDGWAILLVPIGMKEKTYEDFSINTDEGRLKAFGQHDHVRKYGMDYVDRLKSVGFNVAVIEQGEFVSERDIEKFRLTNNKIFYCTKEL